MSIENKVKVPKGMYAVCYWDAYPKNTPPVPKVIQSFGTENAAIDFAREKNNELQKTFYQKRTGRITALEVLANFTNGQDRVLEPEYFVIDDQGMRIF